MMPESTGLLHFRIDPLLPHEQRKQLEDLLALYEGEVSELGSDRQPEPGRLLVDFVSEGSLHLLSEGTHLKICLLDRNQGLFSFGQSLDSSLADAVLDDTLCQNQLDKLLAPRLGPLREERENRLLQVGLRNIKRFETRARASAQAAEATSEFLLGYAQALVDLEKELIHADDPAKIEKVTKLFVKNQLGKSRFRYLGPSDVDLTEPSKNLLALPRMKGQFQAIEMPWEDDGGLLVIQKFFFFHTLAHFFQTQEASPDPFFEGALWEDALDSIPFPVALMSQKGEVHQHNNLFGKLNFPPVDCLKLKVRDKVVINEIPYNIFRKDIHHLDEDKVLFVFFTESFFLKGDGNLTPSGQELGIISSSIAHELNNPIAGIQTALSLLMLDESMVGEARQTLEEMKNGATRCKQLIETFLGFSRANPRCPQGSEMLLSPVEVCYQQAQNLLRFRTVESGIRFQLAYSKHTDFKAPVNLSLLTMTYYLILGELMTLYSHQLLVANKNQIEKVIRGELVESSQEIQIQLLDLNISELVLSKLIQNLLTIENLVLQVSDYSLRFIYNPPPKGG